MRFLVGALLILLPAGVFGQTVEDRCISEKGYDATPQPVTVRYLKARNRCNRRQSVRCLLKLVKRRFKAPRHDARTLWYVVSNNLLDPIYGTWGSLGSRLTVFRGPSTPEAQRLAIQLAQGVEKESLFTERAAGDKDFHWELLNLFHCKYRKLGGRGFWFWPSPKPKERFPIEVVSVSYP